MRELQADLTRQVTTVPGEYTVPSITSLCTITRNRTKMLQRCLSSYARSACQHARRIKIVLADQSDRQSTRQDNVEALESIKKDFGLPCFYAADDEKEQFARQLAKYAGVAPDLARFAICHDPNGPAAYGANRNTLLLDTIDELTVHADDDTICRVSAAGDAGQKLKLTSDMTPQELFYLTEQERCRYENVSHIDDIFFIHEQLLGQSLSSCIERYSSGETAVDLDRCDKGFWRKLEPRLVAMTCIGLVGDSNMGTPYWALFTQGKTRESLVRSEEIYRFCLARQLVSRTARQLTIAERGWKGTPCAGLDNRQLLPPFTPMQRGEDVIFGMLLEFSSSGYLGYLPWMVHHKRTADHCFRTEDLIEYATNSCSYTVMKILLEDSKFPNRSDAAANLTSIGRLLEDWGSLSRRDFDEAIRRKFSDSWFKQIELIEKRLRQYEAQPYFWAADMTSCLEALKSAVYSPNLIVGSDFADADGKGDCLGKMQKFITQFGALIQSWPALRQASRDLHWRGVQLARPV